MTDKVDKLIKLSLKNPIRISADNKANVFISIIHNCRFPQHCHKNLLKLTMKKNQLNKLFYFICVAQHTNLKLSFSAI
jgi:hypothetical protein